MIALVLISAVISACQSAPVRRTIGDGATPPARPISANSASAAAPTTPARIPRDAARFEIESVDDSTAMFRPFEATWLQPGMMVYAVDPAQRDALVARLRIVRADSGRLTALVTSQVTRVTTEHFLLAVKPSLPWYRAHRYWWGVLGGSLATAGGFALAH